MQPITSPKSSLLPLFFFLVVSIRAPMILSVNDPRYTNCRTMLSCGSVANIGYPFWGMNRSSYCGRPGFELKCEDDVAKIMMNENTLRVLNINPEQQILKVAREDYWNGYCPRELIDTAIDFNQFDYSPNLRNLTLFYGCYLPATSTFIFLTNCSINGTLMDVSYSTRNVLSDPRPRVCRRSVLIPVYEAAAQDLEVNPMTMGQALRGGFELQWEVDNDECRRCRDSDGVCGYNQTSNSFICFCKYQPGETTCLPATASSLTPLRLAHSEVQMFIAVAANWICCMPASDCILISLSSQ
ncbi:putative PR5-like receptor kinase [Hibiscus syriacus]|uniref:non-specific serine/threonine protein kinase n=1 Tax=Hibiscus syriacus TaxID=106335 RepID=A0A6A2WAA3_HIBSY|nr:putative PR5-like receptor kinase [Hibiscus syriacus]